MLRKPASFQDSHIAHDWVPGDLVDFSENPVNVVDSAANLTRTITGLELAQGEMERTGTPAGGVADTWPTAAVLLAAIQGNKNLVSPPGNELYGLQPNKSVQLQWPALLDLLAPNATFRRIVRNLTGQIITVTAPATSGVLTSGTMTIAASKWREFLIRIGSSAPSALLPVTTTNANAVLTAVDLTAINQIVPGMAVYGTGIAAGATVLSVNRDAGTITMSANATASGSLIGVTFTPVYTIQNLRAGDI